jgi:hypothetical protein
MRQLVVLTDGTQLSAAMWLWILSHQDVVFLREAPKDSHRIEFCSGETFKDTNDRRYWPVSIDDVPQHSIESLTAQLRQLQGRIAALPRQTGKQKAQWKTEKRRFK